MKHYGPEPPWRAERGYGFWVWIPPRPDDWFEEPGYWELRPPRTTLARLTAAITERYLAPWREYMSSEPILFELLKGKSLPKSEAAKAAE